MFSHIGEYVRSATQSAVTSILKPSNFKGGSAHNGSTAMCVFLAQNTTNNTPLHPFK